MDQTQNACCIRRCVAYNGGDTNNASTDHGSGSNGEQKVKVETLIEQLLFSTVRIEALLSNGTAATGTAFAFSYKWDSKEGVFLVTNKHVVEGASAIRFFFTEGQNHQPQIGHRLDVQIVEPGKLCHPHPDKGTDITVIPIVPILQEFVNRGKEVFFRSISQALIPTQGQLDELDALQQVVFIGYPSGIFDKTNLLPIIRRGTTATPLSIDYCGEPKFLLDASVFPGSSGSPVFLYDAGTYLTRQGGTVIGSRVFFLGVIAEVLYQDQMGRIEFQAAPTTQIPVAKTPQMIDLGVAYKARTVVEAVQDLLKAIGEI
jgi:S1-C subfamily serine protease